jgi:DNA-binding SARP family transcriptional activator
LRRLLKDDEAIRRHQGRLDLDRKRVWVDATELEACLANAVHAMGQERARLVDQTLRLYRGPFLAGDDLPWIVAARERLRARFVRELGEVARVCETAGDPDRAIGSYLRALEIDDRAEDLYRRLMAVYGRLGRRAEMLALYQRCRTTLQTALGVAPSPETDAIARSDAANPRPTS